MKTVLSVFLIAMTGLLAGCGRSGSSSSVTGSVTYKGKPVTGGTMLLHGKDKVFPASLGPDGNYICPSVPAGEYTVTINTEGLKKNVVDPVIGGEEQKLFENKDLAKARASIPAYVPIPGKYADAKTSGLTLTVGSGSNTKDLQLTD